MVAPFGKDSEYTGKTWPLKGALGKKRYRILIINNKRQSGTKRLQSSSQGLTLAPVEIKIKELESHGHSGPALEVARKGIQGV